MERRLRRQRRLGVCTCYLILGALITVAHAEADFTEVGGLRGIGSYTQEEGQGGGIAAADFDNDGDIDIFVPSAAGVADQLYRNLGPGIYEEIGFAAGLDSTASSRSALWVDYDGDHLLDLVVTADCWKLPDECATTKRIRLYRQVSDASFADVTTGSGLVGLFPVDPDSHSAGVSAGDFDGDGFLDLLFREWEGPTVLMRNNGMGGFTDVTASSGISQFFAGHWQAMIHDFDGDGSQDIYSAIDFTTNRLWINDGNGNFTDQAVSAGADNDMNDMGVSLADWDNDGDLDIYVTNIKINGLHNVFLRNDSTVGTLAFTEIAASLGVDDGGWGWGTTAVDVDNDGWLDLVATNGYDQGSFVSDTSRVFLNSATTPLAFTDVSATSGFNDAFWGSALVAFDHDRDGDLDLLQTCAPGGPAPADLRLLDNQSTLAASNKYLVVQPRMSGTNHRAIGAVVRITVGSQQMMRLISAGSSFLGQEPAEAFFGVGDVLIVDQVTVEWPDGTTTQRTNVNPNQVLLVTTGPDADGDGVADFADPDDDNDGTIDSQDCLPLDDQAWSLPQATGSLVMTASNPATLEWGAPPLPGSLSWTFDTIATSVADDFLGAASCLESAGVDTQTVDMDPALPGSIRYYLTRATNLCGHGDGGMTSGGAARTVRSCP